MDWFAVITLGTYPTPTPSGSERAVYFASHGLLGIAAESSQGMPFVGFMPYINSKLFALKIVKPY